MIRYSSAGTRNCGHDAINEVKFLIKEAHRRGIEVTANSTMTPKFFIEIFCLQDFKTSSIKPGNHGCCFQSHS